METDSLRVQALTTPSLGALDALQILADQCLEAGVFGPWEDVHKIPRGELLLWTWNLATYQEFLLAGWVREGMIGMGQAIRARRYVFPPSDTLVSPILVPPGYQIVNFVHDEFLLVPIPPPTPPDCVPLVRGMRGITPGLAWAGSVAIECPHGFDACPQCD